MDEERKVTYTPNIRVKFLGYDCRLRIQYYDNGRKALTLHDVISGEVVAVASVNLPEQEIAEDEVFIKNYSENEGVLEALIEAKVVIPTEVVVPSGFVLIPKCILLI